MNKNEIYVPINNRKEAKQAKAVLRALNQSIWHLFMPNEKEENKLIFSGGDWFVGESKKDLKEITLKQLIELLVSESNDSAKGNDTPAKIAVKVENEKEFKALMKYYDSLGYSDLDGDKPLSIEYPFYYKEDIVSFENNFVFPSKGTCEAHLDNKNTRYDPSQYKIIHFSDFAKEHGIKFPLLTSEDGVDLYEDSDIHIVWKDGAGYEFDNSHKGFKSDDGGWYVNPEIVQPERKIFSTKEAALSWIEAQKPKSIHYDFNPACYVIVDNTGVYINDNGLVIKLGTGQLHKINSMMEELNNG